MAKYKREKKYEEVYKKLDAAIPKDDVWHSMCAAIDVNGQSDIYVDGSLVGENQLVDIYSVDVTIREPHRGKSCGDME